MSASFIPKIFSALIELSGIIGYNKKLTFLTISNVVKTIVFNLNKSSFLFHGS